MIWQHRNYEFLLSGQHHAQSKVVPDMKNDILQFLKQYEIFIYYTYIK